MKSPFLKRCRVALLSLKQLPSLFSRHFTAALTDPLNHDHKLTFSSFQVALTEKWSQIYNNKGIGFYSMHPGWAQTPGVAKSLPTLSEKLSGKLRTSEEGADTVLWLALQPKEKLVSGAFYFDRAEAPKHLALAGTSSSHSFIDAIVDNLRSICSLPPSTEVSAE